MTHDRHEPTGERGVAYSRVSSDEQDTASRRQSIQRWLDRHGPSVTRDYSDVASRDEAHR